MARTLEITKSHGNKLVMEIKSCPFCGDEDVFVAKRYIDGIWKGWKIVCPNCDLVVSSQDHDNKRSLIKEWNRRAK